MLKKAWPLVKVCGIRNESDARIALENGANSVGLLIGLTHKAEDKIDEESGRRIAAMVRAEYPETRIVLVTHLLDPADVKRIAEYVGVTSIQAHDNMSVADIQTLRAAMPGIELMKAIHIEGTGKAATQDAIAKAGSYAPYVDVLLTDSKSVDPDGQLRIGGTGKRHDPKVGRALVDAFPQMPVVLAGGLNADNVADAIRQIRPAGIDANSGLEDADGYKDAGKISVFAQVGQTIPEFVKT
jgi:phosphoribosylanthranilate isomerase